MGFLDKAKQQATQLAQKAQEGVKTGQAKLDQVQTKKKEDALCAISVRSSSPRRRVGRPPDRRRDRAVGERAPCARGGGRHDLDDTDRRYRRNRRRGGSGRAGG